MAKGVLRHGGNVNNSSCSDEGVILHSRLASQMLVCPKTLGVEEKQVIRLIQGMDFR